MSEPLPSPAPPRDVDNAEFWAATAEHRLLVPRCPTCDLVFWHPRSFCPECGSDDIEWLEAGGRGTIYSFTVQRRLTGAYAKLDWNVLAIIELEEGPRLMTNVVVDDVADLRIAQPVELVFDDTGEGSALYRFRPLTER